MKKEMIAFTVPTHMPGHGGEANGYVAIPEGHSMFGVDYDSIPVDVHGGLTFSEMYDPEWMPKHVPKECEGMWIVGFDTLHYNDTALEWPVSKVHIEAMKLQSQLENL